MIIFSSRRKHVIDRLLFDAVMELHDKTDEDTIGSFADKVYWWRFPESLTAQPFTKQQRIEIIDYLDFTSPQKGNKE